jgi:hypothetical protein
MSQLDGTMLQGVYVTAVVDEPELQGCCRWGQRTSAYDVCEGHQNGRAQDAYQQQYSNNMHLLQSPARGRMSNGKDKSQDDKDAYTYSLIEVSKDPNKWLKMRFAKKEQSQIDIRSMPLSMAVSSMSNLWLRRPS